MLRTQCPPHLDEHLVLYRDPGARGKRLPHAFSCRARDVAHAAEQLCALHGNVEVCAAGAIRPGETHELAALRLLLAPHEPCAEADPAPLLEALSGVFNDRVVRAQKTMWRTLQQRNEVPDLHVCALDRALYIQDQIEGATRCIARERAHAANLDRSLRIAQGLLSRLSQVLAGVDSPAVIALRADARQFLAGVDIDSLDGVEILRQCLVVAVGEQPDDWEDADGVPIGRFLVPAVAGDLSSARRELQGYEAENAAVIAAQ